MGAAQRGGTSLELSIIVSCFNQAEALEPTLRKCFQTVSEFAESFEAVVINDGSTDGSVRILDRIRKEFPFVRVTHQLRSGNSRAIRRAFELARGEYLFQVDLSQPEFIQEFGRYWSLRDRYPLILGHQAFRGNRLHRTLFWLQHRWIRLLFGADLVDPNSTTRLCRRDLALQLLGQLPSGFEEINLGMALAAYLQTPRAVLEIQAGEPERLPRYRLGEHLAKTIYYFMEIASLRWKRPAFLPVRPVLSPT